MANAIIESIGNVAFELLLVVLELIFVWVLTKIGKQKALQNTSSALYSLDEAVKTTVLELKQTVVDDLKASAADGKLTKEEIAALCAQLEVLTLKKLSDPVKALLEAAGIDIAASIRGYGEAFIGQLKAEEKMNEPQTEPTREGPSGTFAGSVYATQIQDTVSGALSSAAAAKAAEDEAARAAASVGSATIYSGTI